MIIFSDLTNGTAVYNISYTKRHHQVNKEDINIYGSLVYCKKRYHIKITATAKVRLVVVVKAHKKPVIWDFYGGERLSSTATLLVVDLAKTRLTRVEHDTIASGLEYVVEDANSSSVSLFGNVSCSNQTTTTFVGIMATIYDIHLCKRCMDNSKGPCGFCSEIYERDDDATINVRVTVTRHVTNCVFWEQEKDDWKSDGCQVSVLYMRPFLYVLYVYMCNFVYACACTNDHVNMCETCLLFPCMYADTSAVYRCPCSMLMRRSYQKRRLHPWRVAATILRVLPASISYHLTQSI